MKNVPALFYAALLLFGSAACKHSSAGPNSQGAPAIVPMPMKESQPIADLREFTKAHGLHFRIFCSSYTGAFIGFAWPPTMQFWDIYIEDGAVPAWSADGPTQDETAKRLLKALEKPPNAIPTHRPPPWNEPRKRECPPPVEG